MICNLLTILFSLSSLSPLFKLPNIHHLHKLWKKNIAPSIPPPTRPLARSPTAIKQILLDWAKSKANGYPVTYIASWVCLVKEWCMMGVFSHELPDYAVVSILGFLYSGCHLCPDLTSTLSNLNLDGVNTSLDNI